MEYQERIKKLVYFNKHGEVVEKSHKEIEAETGEYHSWYSMHELNTDYCSKSTSLFLKKYGLVPTVFNVANLNVYGYIYLTGHYIDVVLKHGAIDLRKCKLGKCRL